VVNVADRPNVAMRLRPLEFLLGHVLFSLPLVLFLSFVGELWLAKP
jgi:hypothetical protein